MSIYLCLLSIFLINISIALRPQDLPSTSRLSKKFVNVNDNAKEKIKKNIKNVPFPDFKHLDADDDGDILYVEESSADDSGDGDHNFTSKRALEAIAYINQVSNIPILHSRKGSSNILYLDFDGHVISGSHWSSSSLYCVAYDTDGDYTSMSSNEQNAIKEIWQRVVEDYAPFEIDVTTEAPSTSNGKWSNKVGHALITRNDGSLPAPGAGGVAYVNVHGSYMYGNSDYRPAFVYYNKLGSTSKNIAECASHEFGHNLGLYHDGYYSNDYYFGHGNGATAWAPIMGVGYYRTVTQWSYGDYTGATNQQDDISIISSKLSLGNLPSRSLVSSSASGCNTFGFVNSIIRSYSEKSEWIVTVSGTYAYVSVVPTVSSGGANVDLKLTVKNSAKTVVGTHAPTGSLSAKVTLSKADTYTVIVEADGDSSVPYSSYGSIGQYTISFCNGQVYGVTPTTNSPAPPTPYTTGSGYCCFFDEVDYAGDSFCATSDINSLASSGWDDRISSLYCTGGMYVTVWQGINFFGTGFYSGCDDAFTHIGDLDNWISSIQFSTCTVTADHDSSTNAFRPVTNGNLIVILVVVGMLVVLVVGAFILYMVPCHDPHKTSYQRLVEG